MKYYIISKRLFISSLLVGALVIWVMNVRNQKLTLNCKPETASLLFIGGHEGTGTTLLRAMLDLHPMIRCGDEPKIVLAFLHWNERNYGMQRKLLQAVGVTQKAIDKANAAYIFEIINNTGPAAPMLCHKQPYTHQHMPYLARLFPNAKFINNIRDARGAIESVTRRGINPGYRKEDPMTALHIWEKITRRFLRHCQNLGPKRCVSIRYEKLVMLPEVFLRKLLAFLQVPWDPIVLEHEKHLDEITGMQRYRNTDHNVNNKINLRSLDKWYRPESVLPDWFKGTAHVNSVLMKQLGYAAIGIPPNYTKLSPKVPWID